MIQLLFILYLAGSGAAQDYCNPSPCGSNTDCTMENGRPACACKKTYIGDPLKACYHECEKNEDCSATAACINYRCKDPCVRGCGDYAECRVQNHQAICSCPKDYSGDAYKKCFPECRSKEECPAHLSCIGYHCGNPCTESYPCGRNANCEVKRHTAICTCKPGYIGEPLDGCRRRT